MLEGIIEANLEKVSKYQYGPDYYSGYGEGFEAGVRQVLNDMQEIPSIYPELRQQALRPIYIMTRRTVMYLANKYFGANNV